MSLVNRGFGPFVKRIVAQAVRSEDVQDALRMFARRSAIPLPPEVRELKNIQSPYSSYDRDESVNKRDDIVFITSRFRSGSTALWSAFRQLPDVTAYYEPFNERRFFDAASRGSKVDKTHLGVDDYWTEYDSTTGLAELYDENWIRHDLFMGERAWNPKMKRFIDRLVEQAPGRPVLQFNRVDFRLPWLSRYYPNASILHLYRHPREQWCSFLIDMHEFPRDVSPEQFNYRFYLDRWARDLQHVLPLLQRDQIEHPYQLFYLIWKLSYLFGKRYATHAISYEELATNPSDTLTKLANVLGMEENCAERMMPAISQPRPERWSEYANNAWFENQERFCECLLDDFLGEPDEINPNRTEQTERSRFL